jgi:hypothetical protein
MGGYLINLWKSRAQWEEAKFCCSQWMKDSINLLGSFLAREVSCNISSIESRVNRSEEEGSQILSDGKL